MIRFCNNYRFIASCVSALFPTVCRGRFRTCTDGFERKKKKKPSLTRGYRWLCGDHPCFWKTSSTSDRWYSSQRLSTTNFRNDCSSVGLDPFREHTVLPQTLDALCLVRNANGTSRHLTSVVAITVRPELLSPDEKENKNKRNVTLRVMSRKNRETRKMHFKKHPKIARISVDTSNEFRAKGNSTNQTSSTPTVWTVRRRLKISENNVVRPLDKIANSSKPI